MISTNPLLGPQWEPLAKAIALAIGQCRSGSTFHLQPYLRRYDLSPDRSPYLQGMAQGDFFELELAGNLVVNPPLSEEEYQILKFYGWHLPESTPEQYRDGSQDTPNFSRTYSLDFDADEVAEFILTTLCGVFGADEEDFWGFDGFRAADEISKFNLLGRLKYTDGNPHQTIFALPGHHLDLIESSSSNQK